TPTPALTILALNNGVPKLPEMLAESLGPSSHELLKMIEEFRKEHAKDLQHLQAQSTTSTVERGSGKTTSAPTPSHRTSCVPVYRAGEEVFDVEHVWLPE
ncbi:unnamed protein product, partial [Symbiodinium sp. CCMP2456]